MWHPLCVLLGCLYILWIKLWLLLICFLQQLMQGIPVNLQMILSKSLFFFLSWRFDGILGILPCLRLLWYKQWWLMFFIGPMLTYIYIYIYISPVPHTHCLAILFFDRCVVLVASCDWHISVGYLCEILFVSGIFTSILGGDIVEFCGGVSCTCLLNILSSTYM